MQSSSANFLYPREQLNSADLAEICGGNVVPGARGDVSIDTVSSAADPKRGSLIFVQSRKDAAEPERLDVAGAILCTQAVLDIMPDNPVKIVVDAPQAAFAKIGRHLFADNIGPGRTSARDGYSSRYPDARVSKSALVEDGAVIEAGAVVGDYVGIGRNTIVGANAVIADHCQIGRDCRIGAASVVQYTLIGNCVIILPGARIGQDGFGFVPGPGGLEKVPQLGRVIIQDGVEIGANTTVDRGTLDDTVIGEGTKIDNLVQIAHNVRIGRHCVIAGHCGLSGSVVVGDGCMLGGRVGVADHVTIGAGAQIGASSGVMHNVPDGARWVGLPAAPAKDYFRQVAALRKLSVVDKKPKNKNQQDS